MWASNFIEANFFWKATSDHAAFGIHQICQIQFEYSKNPKTEGRQWCIRQLKQGREHRRNGNWSRKSGTETEIVELKQNCLCVYQGGRILKFVISFLPCSLSLYSLLQLPSTKRKKSLCKTCPFLKNLLWGIFLRYITIVNLAATMCMLANILFTWHRQLRNFCYNDQWREICTTKLY